jgi:putative hydrolase of the HAD superfamily
LERSGHVASDDEAIDRAHYTAVRVFPMDLRGTEDLGPHWNQYLIQYAESLHVDGRIMDDAVEHLRNEYVSVGLWTEVISGSKDGLATLIETGVPVGIVSNSDGTIERRLRSMGILQVGPGKGIEVRCLVDSGSVGVEKPDPRIFDSALDILGVPARDTWYVGDTPAFDVVGAQRAGMRPILMDPFEVNGDFGVDCVASLGEVAALI